MTQLIVRVATNATANGRKGLHLANFPHSYWLFINSAEKRTGPDISRRSAYLADGYQSRVFHPSIIVTSDVCPRSETTYRDKFTRSARMLIEFDSCNSPWSDSRLRKINVDSTDLFCDTRFIFSIIAAPYFLRYINDILQISWFMIISILFDAKSGSNLMMLSVSICIRILLLLLSFACFFLRYAR